MIERFMKAFERLTGKTGASPVAAKLHAHIFGQPLLVHPQYAESLLTSFARGMGLDVGDGDETIDSAPVAASAGTIAVLNITGPLTSRPQPGLCGTPLSYERIRASFDSALDDSNVSAIVLRVDSCGGECAGCFDLADHIFESRGKKPIIAQVDSRAYSAAYALASACDSIQVIRTAGVGSIGVFSAFVDQSAYDKQSGLAFEFIFSGAHKIDGNPHAPLPDSVRNDWQAKVNAVRQLFAETVARNRGMTVEAVLATEAADFMDDAGIAIGLADSIGTLSDTLAMLATPAPAPPDQPTDEVDEMTDATAQPAAQNETPEQKAAREQRERMNAAKADLSDAVVGSKLTPAVQASVLKRGPVEGSNAADLVQRASMIQDACVAAGLPDYAADYAGGTKSIDVIRAELAGAKATPPQRQVSNHLRADRAYASGDANANNPEHVFGPGKKELTERAKKMGGDTGQAAVLGRTLRG